MVSNLGVTIQGPAFFAFRLPTGQYIEYYFDWPKMS
jgi:hypothetical protein